MMELEATTSNFIISVNQMVESNKEGGEKDE